MNVFAIDAANAHIVDLLAEAEARRLAAAVKPKGRGRIASLAAAVRKALEPQAVLRLGGYPYRS